jgi:hypothetical protein
MEISSAPPASSYASPSGATPAPASTVTKSALTTFAVRALGLYFFAYFLSGQVGDRALPGPFRVVANLGVPLERLDDHIGPWLGLHVFGMADLTGGGAGSGDGPREWIQTLWYVAAAVVIAGAWTAMRGRFRNPERTHQWFRAFLRYPLAFSMIEYGVWKFARVQFGVLPLQQQMTPLGEFSPSALMWAFMSYSYWYRAFAGFAEVLGGVLLLWRRTTMLGALIVFAAMSNVLALNLSYDVSVKMLAGHLLLMSVILLVPELPRLTRIFVLNRATGPASLPPFVADSRSARWLRYAAMLYAAYGVGTVVWDNASMGARAHSGQPVPLAGIYDVESLTRNGVAVTGASDARRWNRVAIEPTGFLTIQFPDDRTESFMTDIDLTAGHLMIVQPTGGIDARFDYRNYFIPFTRALIATVPPSDSRRSLFTLEQPDRAHIRLSGRLHADSIDVVLRRFDQSRQLLQHWGSHLVNRLNFSDTWIVAPYSGWPVDSSTGARR